MGELSAAYLIGWAALRAAAQANGLVLPRGSSEAFLDAAYGNGLVSPDDYSRLYDAVRVRNALAHGLRTPDASESDIQDVIIAATRLAGNLSSPAA